MDRTRGAAARRLGWAVLVGVVAACGGSPATNGGVSAASTSGQTCTTSIEAPLPLSALQYDARPNPPVNLLQNGDVEAGSGTAPANWRVDGSPAGATLAWDTARVLSGTHALLVATTAPGRAAWSQDVGAVEAGLRYRLHANVFASAAATGTHALEIVWLDGGGKEVGHDVLQSNSAGAWAEVDGFVTAPSAAAKATVAVSALAPGQYNFDDVMLVTAEPDPVAIDGGFPLGYWGAPGPGAVQNRDFMIAGAPGRPLAWQRSLAAGNATLTYATPGTLEIDGLSDYDASWFQNVDVAPQLTYQLEATVFASTRGGCAVEIAWRDASGNILGTSAVSPNGAGVWSQLSSGPIIAPSGATAGTIRFRAQHGTCRAELINLTRAASEQRIFDPGSQGFSFSMQPDSALKRTVAIAPFATLYDAASVDPADSVAVATAAADAGTALWFAGGEIAWEVPLIPATTVKANYDLLSRNGGQLDRIPVWLNHAPRGTRADPTNYSLLRPYSDGADIVSMDIYPVPAIGHGILPNEGPWSVGEYTDILRDSAGTWGGAQRKVLWMVLQGFDWWEERSRETGAPSGDHAVAVEWLDAARGVLRVDAMTADRTNAWRQVLDDGIVPPAGAAFARVKVGAYLPGTYAFANVAFAPQGGAPLLDSGDVATEYADGTPRGETIVGIAPVDVARRYKLSARILAQTRPTLEQFRFMAWDAIIHGARGLSWWGLNYVFEGDALLADLGEVTRELRGLSDDLLAPLSLREVRSSDPKLEALLVSGRTGLFLAVANRTMAPVSATLGISGVPPSSIQRVASGCALTRQGDVLRDDFQPLAVHLYRIQ